MEMYIGQIFLFGGDFAPRGSSNCNGQQLSISSNNALFSLLGTSYGGDGRSTFALPDLRGRVPVNYGDGPGLSSHKLGDKSGKEKHQLTQNEMPAHSHPASFNPTGAAGVTVNAAIDAGNDSVPQAGYVLAAPPKQGPSHNINIYRSSPGAGGTVALGGVTFTGGAGTVTVDNAGGSTAFDISQPSLALNYCIAIEGIYPSRS